MNNKSCWNCKHSVNHRTKGYPDTQWEPGEPPMIEGCDAVEDYVGNVCQYWDAEIVRCNVCKKEHKAIDTIHISDEYSEGYACSKTCEEEFVKKMRYKGVDISKLEGCGRLPKI